MSLTCGIDVGGTKIAGAVVAEDGTVLEHRRVVSPAEDPEAIEDAIVGLVADSVLFLWLAFGSLDYLAGQIVGKLWMVLLALPFIHWIRKRELAA